MEPKYIRYHASIRFKLECEASKEESAKHTTDFIMDELKSGLQFFSVSNTGQCNSINFGSGTNEGKTDDATICFYEDKVEMSKNADESDRGLLIVSRGRGHIPNFAMFLTNCGNAKCAVANAKIITDVSEDCKSIGNNLYLTAWDKRNKRSLNLGSSKLTYRTKERYEMETDYLTPDYSIDNVGLDAEVQISKESLRSLYGITDYKELESILKSYAKYDDKSQRWTTNKDENGIAYTLVFRGQNELDWSIYSSLYRYVKKIVEDYYHGKSKNWTDEKCENILNDVADVIEKLIAKKPEEKANNQENGKLSSYIDISYNPSIAYAFSRAGKKASAPRESVVYVFLTDGKKLYAATCSDSKLKKVGGISWTVETVKASEPVAKKLQDFQEGLFFILSEEEANTTAGKEKKNKESFSPEHTMRFIVRPGQPDNVLDPVKKTLIEILQHNLICDKQAEDIIKKRKERKENFEKFVKLITIKVIETAETAKN